MDDGYDISVLLLFSDILQYFMVTLLVEISFDVIAIDFHDVYTFIVFEYVDGTEIFVFETLNE